MYVPFTSVASIDAHVVVSSPPETCVPSDSRSQTVRSWLIRESERSCPDDIIVEHLSKNKSKNSEHSGEHDRGMPELQLPGSAQHISLRRFPHITTS